MVRHFFLPFDPRWPHARARRSALFQLDLHTSIVSAHTDALEGARTGSVQARAQGKPIVAHGSKAGIV